MFKYEKIFQAVVHTKFYFSRVNIACWNFNFTVDINLKENVYPLKQEKPYSCTSFCSNQAIKSR